MWETIGKSLVVLGKILVDQLDKKRDLTKTKVIQERDRATQERNIAIQERDVAIKKAKVYFWLFIGTAGFFSGYILFSSILI